MAKRRSTAIPPNSASDRAERLLIESAIGKIQRSQTPSSQERAALKRFERAQEEERRWQYVQNTPKGMYCEMAGRPRGVVIEQARRYGLPYPAQKTAKVDLAEVICWLHDFLAANKTRLSAPPTDDPMLVGASSPALERYREERARLARLERLQKEGSLLPIAVLHESHGRLAGLLRSAGETLARQFGVDAQAILTEALDEYQNEVNGMFGADDPTQRDRPGHPS